MIGLEGSGGAYGEDINEIGDCWEGACRAVVVATVRIVKRISDGDIGL